MPVGIVVAISRTSMAVRLLRQSRFASQTLCHKRSSKGGRASSPPIRQIRTQFCDGELNATWIKGTEVALWGMRVSQRWFKSHYCISMANDIGFQHGLSCQIMSTYS